MQLKQAPRVTANPFAGLGLKAFFCLFLFSVLLTSASAENRTSSSNRINIAPSQLPIASLGVPYSATPNVRGGIAPYQFSFVHGVIPPGLSLDTRTGTVTGTPTATGSFSFRVAISDVPNADQGEVTLYLTVSNSVVVGITVSPSSASMPSGGTQQFSANVTNASNGAVTWTAEGGTISSSGLFTARSVTTTSTATVTATSVADPTKYARAVVTVNPSTGVAVMVSPSSSSLLAGASQQFTATVSNTSNTAVTWSANGGTISSSGLFTAPSVNATTSETVTATSVADPTKHSQATITVNPSASVSVAVSPTSSSLPSGGSQRFAATVSNTSNTGVSWSANGGTISTDGVFTAPSVSSSTTATITATSLADRTKSAHASVTVNPSASISVTISPSSISMLSAGTQQFIATVSNTSNTGVTWTTSSGAISASGVFIAPSVTSSTAATVIATSIADTTQSAQATVYVNPQTQGPPPPPPPSTGADNTYCGTGDTANFGGNDTVATLPQACINTALANTPSPGQVINVPAGGSIQSAIASAACGDTIMIQAGASFRGTFSLPNKGCDSQHWITIRSSAPDSALPPEGTRLTPCYAGVASLPGRPVYYCASTVSVVPTILAGGNQAFQSQSGAGYYRLIGLEITNPPGMPTGQPDTLVGLTDNTQLPHHMIIDRCWIHGLAGTFAKRGVKMDGQYLAVIDSTITDIHAVGWDNQGIASGTGTGPLKIVNNFIEGGSSSIGFGGQGNPFGNPQDVEVRRNHLFVPLSQMANSPSWDGLAWDVKQRLESKNSNRVLIEGNILENAWGDAGTPNQGGDGSISWLGPKNQSSACPTCDVSDITIRFNRVRHAGGGFYVFDAPSDTGAIAVQAKRYSIHDNVFDDISTAWSRNGGSVGYLHRFLGGSSYLPPRDVAIFHNTGLTTGNGFLSLVGSSGGTYVNFSYTNNLEVNGTYGIMGCASLMGTAVLNGCAPGYTFAGNVIVGGKANIAAGAFEPATASAVGFAIFNNGNGGDYRLCQGPGNPVSSCTAASPYMNAGTDGRDIGADVNTLNSLISGVN